MELKRPSDVVRISRGDVVTKRNLYDLIQYSKVPGSEYWEGDGNQIWNTPQQGINWLGAPPYCQAVLIKTRPGSYRHDGWRDDRHFTYHYSFKAVRGRISHVDTANAVLIEQPEYGYPILLFLENGSSWICEGSFAVTGLQEEYVILERGQPSASIEQQPAEALRYAEGGRRFVSHLLSERNASAVKALKATVPCICDICHVCLTQRYGVECIEAHHKTPISTFSSSHEVVLDDFVLLCPNCHRAVHAYMREQGLGYTEIKRRLAGIGISQPPVSQMVTFRASVSEEKA